jgi:transposase
MPVDIEDLDLGYTEVFTDTDGIAYGENLGEQLTEIADSRTEKYRKRNKLKSLAEKYEKLGYKHKVRNIRKFNLGTKKRDALSARQKATVDNIINNSINTLFKTKNPKILVTEDLNHNFKFGKIKKVNNRLSSWVRGRMKQRIMFKALVRRSDHKQVNSAYTPQTCPVCGFTDSKNRKQDRFQCLQCKHVDHADRVAALNLLARCSDDEITRYTPYRKVKTVLLERFHRRVETEGVNNIIPEGTIPDRTLDTVLFCESVAKFPPSGEEDLLKSLEPRRSIRERN